MPCAKRHAPPKPNLHADPDLPGRIDFSQGEHGKSYRPNARLRQSLCFDDPEQLECITRLPKAQQRFVMQMIDTVLQQQVSRQTKTLPVRAGLQGQRLWRWVDEDGTAYRAAISASGL